MLHFTAATGLPHDNVNGICEDGEGQIWVATWGGGLACWDPRGLETVDRSPLPHLLAQQDPSRVWMLRSSLTTEAGGSYRSSPGREQLSFSDVNQSTVTQRDIDIDALCIATDPQGDLWIGGRGGLRHLTTAASERLDLAEDLVVTAILPVVEGLYLGLRTATRDHIQFAFHDGKNLQIIWEKRSDEVSSLPPILRIIRTRDQDLFFVCHFSHQAGSMHIWSEVDRFLARWNPASGLTWYSSKDGLPHDRVYDLLADRSGVLWVATWGGIGRYDGTRFEHVVSPNAPADQAIFSICENRQGHLLFGTSTGALRYDGQIFQTLGSQELANITSIAEDARDRLWFSTPQGTKCYTPAKVPPRVRPTQTIADQIHEDAREIRTSTATRQIIFEYKGMSFRTPPRDLLYRHRLQGLEDDWQQPTRATRAIYRELPPGDYTFEVKAIDRDLNESTLATIALQIVPDERDQRIDELEQRVRERTAALEESNRQIREATQHKSNFLARMSHDLRTPMNAIVGFSKIVHRRAKDLLPERQVENLEKVLQSSELLMSLINDILDLSKIEAGVPYWRDDCRRGYRRAGRGSTAVDSVDRRRPGCAVADLAGDGGGLSGRRCNARLRGHRKGQTARPARHYGRYYDAGHGRLGGHLAPQAGPGHARYPARRRVGHAAVGRRLVDRAQRRQRPPGLRRDRAQKAGRAALGSDDADNGRLRGAKDAARRSGQRRSAHHYNHRQGVGRRRARGAAPGLGAHHRKERARPRVANARAARRPILRTLRVLRYYALRDQTTRKYFHMYKSLLDIDKKIGDYSKKIAYT